jgi:hypothetical protein
MVLDMAEEEAVLVLERSKGLGLLLRVELDECCGSPDDDALGVAA